MATSPLTLESLNPSGSITTRQFWIGAGERAAKSFAQGFLTGFGFSTVGEAVVEQASALSGATWLTALTLGAAMAVLSIMTSILNPQFTSGKIAVLEKPVPGGVPESTPVEGAATGTSTLVPSIPRGTGAHRADTEGGGV